MTGLDNGPPEIVPLWRSRIRPSTPEKKRLPIIGNFLPVVFETTQCILDQAVIAIQYDQEIPPNLLQRNIICPRLTTVLFL